MEPVILFPITLNELKTLIKDCLKTELQEHDANAVPVVQDEGLISMEDVQQIFKVTKVTIHKWKKMGLLPYHKLNRRLYFKKEEVLKALNKISFKSAYR